MNHTRVYLGFSVILPLLGVGAAPAAGAEATVRIQPNWKDPELQRAWTNLPASRATDGSGSKSGASHDRDLPILGLPLAPATPTPAEIKLQVRDTKRGGGTVKLKLPDCAKGAPAVSMVQPETADVTWYTRNYDFGCINVSISGAAETVPLEQADELTRAALTDTRSTEAADQWDVVDENDDIKQAGTFERTVTIAKIPYSVALECYAGAESFCADQAQRDALIDQLILVRDQPVTPPPPGTREAPEPGAAAPAATPLPGAAQEGPASRGAVIFSYHAPGELVAGSGSGPKTRRVYFPGIAFPLKVGPAAGPKGEDASAYANSQIYPKSGGVTHAYPWQDDYCETRSWSMPLCPSSKGHQGQDIRASTKANKYWPGVAMDDGVITQVTKNTTVTVRADAGYSCRYLHLDWASIANLKVGQRVKKGQTPIGLVSNIMGGKPDTSLHLHFDCRRNVGGKNIHHPVYSSLVEAYRTAWGLPSALNNGDLAYDQARELGNGGGPPITPPIDSSTGGDDTIPKTERTKNYGALTVNSDRSTWPDYLKSWPGLLPDNGIQDKSGDLILAFETEQSGVGAWWYWITQRKGFGVTGAPTLAALARGIAGTGASQERVDNYLTAYTKLAAPYFGHPVSADEPLPLANPDSRWNLARTMFHHESGRQPVITRATFDCGVALGNAVIAGEQVDLTRYTGNCAPTLAGGTGSAGGNSAPPASVPPAAKPDPQAPVVAPPAGDLAQVADLIAALKEQVKLSRMLIDRTDALYQAQRELNALKAAPGCGGK